MDGNGRWAKARGLTRTKGHEAGEAALLDVIHGAIELGIGQLSALRVLDGELEAVARRGAVPDGLQPGRHVAGSATSWTMGVRGPLGGRRPAPVAVGDQGARGRPSDERGTTTSAR